MNIRKFSLQFLNECFVYNSETGELVWRNRPLYHFANIKAQRRFNVLFAGKQAGHWSKDGYIRITVCDTPLVAQQICWALGSGDYSKYEIDHINGNNSDNRLVNLRDVTHTVNGKNSKMSKNCTTGVTGVNILRSRGREYFMARASVGGSYLNKTFKSFEDAVEWRRKMLAADGEYTDRHGGLN